MTSLKKCPYCKVNPSDQKKLFLHMFRAKNCKKKLEQYLITTDEPDNFHLNFNNCWLFSSGLERVLALTWNPHALNTEMMNKEENGRHVI